jgi:uncharacterized protein YbaR (Trm112 family)
MPGDAGFRELRYGSFSPLPTALYIAPLYNAGAMISQDLLDMLVCPVCKKPVVLNANGGSLKCSECRRVYPIQDGIPIMLVDAAAIDSA